MYPCVTDKESWTSGVYIETLFGKLCSGSSFSYDEDVRLVKAKSGRPSCENSSSKDAHIRIDSTSSKQVLHNSDLVLGPASGPSSLNPLKSVGSEISRVTPSSSNFKKRRGIPRSSHRKKTQTTPWMHLQEPMKRKDDHAAAGTLSVWLESSDIDSDTSGRPGTKMVEDLNSITFVHGKRASASSARISVNGGRGRTLPSCRAMQSQDRLNSRGKHHRRPKADDTAYPHPNPASRDISTGIKPCVSRGGTPLIATKILDISESETGAGVVYNVQTRPDNPVEEAANSSQDLKTQLSAVQSIFGPQDPTQSPNAQRLQHRKDVYDRVKCDDGYAWGRDCGLLSTVMRHEHDEVEL